MAGPVNRFPGDLVWQITRDRLSFFPRIAREYGDVVDYMMAGRRFMLLVHPDAVRDVLLTRADAFNKGPVMRRSQGVLGNGLLTSEGDFHRRQRRIAQPVFHPQRMAAYAPIIVEYSERTRDRWRDGVAVDVHAAMMHLALEIVSKTLFGAEVEKDVEAIGDAMDVIVKGFTRLLSPLSAMLNRLPLPSTLKLKRSVRMLHELLDRIIQERHAAQSHDHGDRRDLVSLMLRARDVEGDHGGMTEQQVRDECLTIFAAGHETTANALTFAFMLLSANPEAEAQVHQEIDAVLQGRLPAASDMDRLVCTRAAVAEAMRLYPPGWTIARQATVDVTVNGTFVPAETTVLLSPWIVHRDPRWWPQPEQFRLERWLAPDPDRPRWSYFPFGGGPRSCIGEAFAWTEAVLGLATIAQRWRVEIPDPNPKLLPTITLRPKYGLKGIPRKR